MLQEDFLEDYTVQRIVRVQSQGPEGMQRGTRERVPLAKFVRQYTTCDFQ